MRSSDWSSSGCSSALYDAAMRHKADGTRLVVVAGKEHGTGSSRDWAAKGTILLGVRAVIVESFERIHRSNLVGMGVLPLQFQDGQTRETLGLTSDDSFTILGVAGQAQRSEEHTPELQSLMRISYADLRLKQKKIN